MSTTPPDSPPPEPTPPEATPPAGPPVVPQVPAVERVRQSYVTRNDTDYIFESPGMNVFLAIITCGIWLYYCFYQLMRRMRDHNKRRLEELEAATEVAWDAATRQGVAEELRPDFERVQSHLAVMRSMTGDFRDPAIWLVIAIFANIAIYVAYIFLDGDLIKHDQNEGAIEAELTAIFERLGQPLPAPDPRRVKGKQNYVGRIIAALASCGIYGFWWFADMQTDVNRHFQANWAWEDALASAVQQLAPAA